MVGDCQREEQTHQSRLVGDCPPPIEERRIIPIYTENNIKDLMLDKKQRVMIDNESVCDNELPPCVNFENSLQHNHRGHAQPVIDPIWRGSFNILNEDYDTIEGFVAHVSSKVCRKVCEVASLLPSLLCLEMLPKSVLWPKRFKEYETSGEDVALYFFQADTRHERVFDHLVKGMISCELAMRTRIKDVDLLIFTSRELPLGYWRFQGKYYLWGVFKGKKDGSSHPVNHHLMVANRSSEFFGVYKFPRWYGQWTQKSHKHKDFECSESAKYFKQFEHEVDMDPESGD